MLADVQSNSGCPVPRVGVGVPVRNGERYLAAALDSLLAQTFQDFEVVICDNASTDGTERICREFVARDARVRYVRHARNLGPAQNYNKCFELTRGEYFRWHAHDDLVHPEYLARTTELLDRDPGVVVCHSLTRLIDEQARRLREYDFAWGFAHPSPAARFASFVMVNHRRHVGYEIFGLMRRSALLTTPLQGAYAHGDRVLLARMCLRGRFHEVPEHLFLSRFHPNQSMQAKTTRARYLAFLGTGPLPPTEWWDASKLGKVVFPEWNLLAEYWRAVGEVKLAAGESAKCRLAILRWVLKNLPKLGRDVAYAIEHLLTCGGASAPEGTSARSGAVAPDAR